MSKYIMLVRGIAAAFLFLCMNHIQAQDDITRFADSLRREAKIPELAFAIIKDSAIVRMEVLGYHRSDAPDSARIDDHFHLGSNTKAITSFLAAKLVEAGKIKWDTRIIDVFPEWKDSILTTYHEVTLQDLLSHRAGIRAFTSGIEFMQLPTFEGETGARRILFSRWLLQQAAVRPKLGEKTVYSNAGYAIATAMLEKVADKSWGMLVLDCINNDFKGQVGFSWPNREDTNQPWGHMGANPTPPDFSYRLDPMVAPAGDLNMNINDYARFVQAHLQGLRGQDNILKADTYRFLHYGAPEYAMGWGVLEKEGKRMSFHDGSAGTFYTHTVIIPEDNIAIIVLTNIAGEGISKVIYALRKRLTTP